MKKSLSQIEEEVGSLTARTHEAVEQSKQSRTKQNARKEAELADARARAQDLDDAKHSIQFKAKMFTGANGGKSNGLLKKDGLTIKSQFVTSNAHDYEPPPART